MPSAGEILRKFYEAVAKKDIAAARSYLDNDLLFLGLLRHTTTQKNTSLP